MAQPSRPAPGRRRWTWVLAALGLLLALGALTLSRLLQPERLSAFVLEQAAAATGLELRVSQPADVGLWPDLHIEIIGLVAQAPGHDRPLFTAERVDLVLPWSSLVDREAVVQRLRLIGPVLHRQDFMRWLQSRPAPATPQPFQLPELTAGLDIAGGEIVGESQEAWAIRELQLATSALLPGRPFEATLSGVLHLGEQQHPLQLELRTTPRQQGQVLRLQPLAFSIRRDDMPSALALQGGLELQHPERLWLELDGELAEWPQGWPTLPLPELGALALSLAYDGPADLSGNLELEARGSGASLQADASVPAVLEWVRAAPGTPLPPARAALAAERMVLGGAALEQVQVRLAEDVPATEAAPQP